MMPALLEKLLAFFYINSDSQISKKKTMKQLTKELLGNRYALFYRPKTGAVEAHLAIFFFELYRIISHAHVSLNNAAKSEILKELTIETFLDISCMDARQRLSAEYVKEQAKTVPITEVSLLLKKDFDLLASGIDSEIMASADRCYNQILALVNFSTFDFFFLLKRFDPSLVENNFNLRPHFSPVPGRHLCDQIKDFLEVSGAIDTEQDWGAPLRVLKLYKNGVDVISPEEWGILVSRLRELKRSNILELMIRHIEGNPSWRFNKTGAVFQRIALNYLEDREKEVRQALNGFVRDQKLLGARNLAVTVFGDPDIRRAVHYTPQESDAFVKRGLDGYTCAEGFNYIKAFLLDVFKDEMQELCELLLIRGQWYAMEFSQKMFESYHILIGAADRIVAFDDSLGRDGETGSRLQAMLSKADRDKSQTRYITSLLKKINDDALEFINVSAQAFIVIGTTIKNALEDRKSGAGDLIINWKELESMVEPSLVKSLIAAYRQIFGLLQILRLLSGLESDTEVFEKEKAGQLQS